MMVRSFWATIVALALVSGACATENPDTDAVGRAERALADAGLGEVELDWNTDTRMVRLQGAVETDDERNKAEQVVTDAMGTSGRVLNELTVESPAYYQPDNTHGSLRANLENIMRREFGAADQFNINFDIGDNGAVAIKGRVDTQEQKERVETLVRSTQGVVDVVNNLEVRARK